MRKVLSDKTYGPYREVRFHWELTPRWLQWVGFKPYRQYTMIIPDPDGPGGFWRYAKEIPGHGKPV